LKLKLNSKIEYPISLYNNYQLVELKFNKIIIIKFKDIILNVSDLITFTRTINNLEYIYLKMENY
jgi:hypothetical protein